LRQLGSDVIIRLQAGRVPTRSSRSTKCASSRVDPSVATSDAPSAAHRAGNRPRSRSGLLVRRR
jgi:hypothetical protein